MYILIRKEEYGVGWRLVKGHLPSKSQVVDLNFNNATTTKK
jgi:hypothetical protein